MMKHQLLKLALGSGLLLMAGAASAANMECKVGTQQNDGWSSSCFGMNYNFNYVPVNTTFRIQNLAAPVASVIWQGSLASACAATATSCTVKAQPYQENTVSAIVLYSNGTYESVSATAWFETGF
jgi:hypothetical protein